MFPLTSHRLGFNDFCMVEDVAVAYPLLDMVDHDNRRKIVSFPHHIYFASGIMGKEKVIYLYMHNTSAEG